MDSTSTTTSSSRNEIASKSIRYQRLLEMIDLTLAKSRSEINLQRAIQQCYGNDDDDDDDDDENDIGNLGGNSGLPSSSSSNHVFQTILDGSLEKAHRNVKGEMTTYIQELNVAETLYRFEAAIVKYNADVEKQQLERIRDKESAVVASKRIKLDDNENDTTTFQDKLYALASFHAAQKLQAEKLNLQQQLESLDNEINTLETNHDEVKVQTEQRFVKLQNLTTVPLQKSADICSLLSS